jgi:hypothetical protein
MISTENYLTTLANSGKLDKIQEIFLESSDQLKKLDRFFDWYLDTFEEDMLESSNHKVFSFYNKKMNEYESIKRIRDLSKYYVGKYKFY